MPTSLLRVLAAAAILVTPVAASAQTAFKVLATNRTATMEKEMNQAAEMGLRFGSVMGGETAVGGKEVVVVMKKAEGTAAFQYRLLATSKTSTMKRELQDAADAGYVYVGQTVFETLFGGKEVVCILEREQGKRGDSGWEYELLATSRTSTMEKELQGLAGRGYELVGLTLGQTAMGGAELVTILRRKR
ncbi:MAG: hypothetical protein JNL48_17185 [Acidobacteria bacterium]|jgi:hypothetical protein|nr:hypothetical protein [Acidobacteriota bacterium]